MSSITFNTASTVEQVVAALAAGARPIAGGTDLVVGARQGKAPLPDHLVSIDQVESLRELHSDGGGLRLGALVTHDRIVANPAICSSYSAIADASAIVGSHATRANGTIGGNVMNGSPAMDTGGALLCLGASALLTSSSGTRSVPFDELFVGPGRTSATSDELLVAIEVPAPSTGTGSCYVRLEYRRQMEIAIVGASAVVLIENGVITAAKVAMTALAPTIRRSPEAEAALVGSAGTRSDVEAAAAAFAASTAAISDVRASASYRTAMAAVICRRAVQGALMRAAGTPVAIPASDSLRGLR